MNYFILLRSKSFQLEFSTYMGLNTWYMALLANEKCDSVYFMLNIILQQFNKWFLSSILFFFCENTLCLYDSSSIHTAPILCNELLYRLKDSVSFKNCSKSILIGIRIWNESMMAQTLTKCNILLASFLTVK